MLRRSFPAAILLALLTAPALRSQVFVVPNQLPVGTRINNLAINGAIGSVTGLAWAIIRHSSKWDGVKLGAAGGFLMSAGRQIAATKFDGSGFLGREVSAVGVSLVASPGEQQTAFFFPVGPMSVEYAEGSWDWRLNVTDFVATVRLAISPHMQLDLGRSLSSGAPVFRDDRFTLGTEDDYILTALTGLGSIRLSRRAIDPVTGEANVLYHERVHILQDDYFQGAIALPAERTVVEHLPFGRRFLRHLDVGALGPALESGLTHFIPYESRPWEREAYSLTANLAY